MDPRVVTLQEPGREKFWIIYSQFMKLWFVGSRRHRDSSPRVVQVNSKADDIEFDLLWIDKPREGSKTSCGDPIAKANMSKSTLFPFPFVLSFCLKRQMVVCGARSAGLRPRDDVGSTGRDGRRELAWPMTANSEG